MRSVGENMAEVRVAPAAQHFLARHSVAHVTVDLHFLFIHRCIETRPTRTGMKFCLRRKQRLSAADADVHAGFFRIFVLTRARWLSALLPGHVILVWCKNLAPLRFALTNFFAHRFSPASRDSARSRSSMRMP